MYRVVFRGGLLEGFEAEQVRRGVAARLQLGEAQLARMFSGRKIILKKAVTEEGGRPYLEELRRLGLDARLETLPEEAEPTVLATFQVVFWGKLLRGFQRELVMRAATRRLRVPSDQLSRMFDGGKVVLKRGVSAALGARYVTELARIGMLVELEVETVPLPEIEQQAAQAAGPADREPLAELVRTQLDMSQAIRTALVQSDILGQPEPEVEEGVVPDFKPKGLAMPAMDAHAAGPAKAASHNVLQVKCPQCGRHQLPGPRCRTCGLEMGSAAAATPAGSPAKPPLKARRMDASALGAVTTLMQGLRKAVAPTAPADNGGVPTWMFRLRDNLATQEEVETQGLQRKYLVLGGSVAFLLLVWWVLA